ncbi:MAG: hypothetical protein WCT53_03485 [Candidatus Gracilibacteria bacterium]
MSNPLVPGPREDSSASTGLLNQIRNSKSPLMQSLRMSAAAFQLFLVSAGIAGCDVKDGAETSESVDAGMSDGGEGEGEGSTPLPPQRIVKPGMMRQSPVQYNQATGESNVLGECELVKYVYTNDGWVPVTEGTGPEEEIPADVKDNDCDGFTDEPNCSDPANAGADMDSSNGNVGYCDDDGTWNVVETPDTISPTDEKCNDVDDDLDGKTDYLACPPEKGPNPVNGCKNEGEITVTLEYLPATNEGEGAMPATNASVCAMKDNGDTELMEVVGVGPEALQGYTPAKEGSCTPGDENTYGSDVGACSLNQQFCVGEGGEGTWTKGFGGKDPVAEPRGDGHGEADQDCDDGATRARAQATATQF